MTTVFKLSDRFGAFLADGELANAFRFTHVEPAVANREHVVLDFEGVTNMTDSFGNALVGTLIENHPDLLQRGLEFKNCNALLQSLISIAVKVGRTAPRRQVA